MDVAAWLEEFHKLDELIRAKEAERLRIWESACGTVAGMDGMPHAPGIADKVGNYAVKLAAVEEVIRRYEAEKAAKVAILERLPAMEYGVLHREYIRGMTRERIAEEMDYSAVQIWRIKKRAMEHLLPIIPKR